MREQRRNRRLILEKKASEVAISILDGDDYEKETYEEVFMINKDNVDMYGTDGWQ